MQIRPLGALLVLATLALAAPARADEAPPPSYFSCSGKKVGDACDGEDGPGKCVADRCSRLDYSQGTPPTSVESDCLKCRKADPVPADAPVANAPAPTPDQPPATVTAGSAPTAAPAAKSGCRVDPDAGAAPLLLLAAFAALRRRRRAP